MGHRAVLSQDEFQGPKIPVFVGQNLLHNLTMDEVQNLQLNNNIEKPLNAMNLDELVKNVISVEDGHFSQNQSSSSSSSSPSVFHTNLNSNGTFRKKTADDIWNEIVHQEPVNEPDKNCTQSSLEETTLEDFLIHSGVMNVSNQGSVFNMNPQPLMDIDRLVIEKSENEGMLLFQMGQGYVHHLHQQQHMTTTMAMQAVVESNFQVSEMGYGDSIAELGFSGNRIAMPMPVQAVAATTSSDSQSYSQVNVGRKQQFADEVMEKTIERRQQRMIKNRESAARSRARKQAYTNRLEHEAFHLRRTNTWLKKLKESERLLQSNLTSQARYQLRRTSSAAF